MFDKIAEAEYGEQDTKKYYGNTGPLSWDDKRPGAYALIAITTREEKHMENCYKYCDTNIISYIFQRLNWVTIALICVTIISFIFSILDVFEVPFFCCKKKQPEITLKDEAKLDVACRKKKCALYENLEKGDEEEKELLNDIKVWNEKEQNLLKNKK